MENFAFSLLSRCFFRLFSLCLSWCLLVEFWWRLKAAGKLKWTFGVLWVFLWSPGGFGGGAAGVSQEDSESRNVSRHQKGERERERKKYKAPREREREDKQRIVFPEVVATKHDILAGLAKSGSVQGGPGRVHDRTVRGRPVWRMWGGRRSMQAMAPAQLLGGYTADAAADTTADAPAERRTPKTLGTRDSRSS